jgi:NAD(P)-dependent dehydrogenase (short-subunit alcohol dehydrogenase family)
VTPPVEQTITLVTGANKGLGLETARRLRDAGHTVLLSARDVDRGERAADGLGVEFVPIDVTDDASVEAAADHVRGRHGRLDVLVNNAGVVGPRGPLAGTTAAEVLATLDTNLLGVVRVTHAFLPLLRAAANPRIVNVSSGTGRLTWQHESGWPQEKAPPVYSTSKAALTMLTLQYAHALPGIRVNAAFPGYTATDLNDHAGTQTVTEGTDVIVRLATLPPDGPTGTAQLREGVTTPW